MEEFRISVACRERGSEETTNEKPATVIDSYTKVNEISVDVWLAYGAHLIDLSPGPR